MAKTQGPSHAVTVARAARIHAGSTRSTGSTVPMSMKHNGKQGYAAHAATTKQPVTHTC